MTKSRNHKISISSGMSGFYAIEIAEYHDEITGGWYLDCVQTGIGRYQTKEEAIEEGKEWALADEIELDI